LILLKIKGETIFFNAHKLALYKESFVVYDIFLIVLVKFFPYCLLKVISDPKNPGIKN